MDTRSIQIVAGVLALVVLFIIIWRRKQKTAK
jgi:LPXTG-motif cell wall-anchored protein